MEVKDLIKIATALRKREEARAKRQGSGGRNSAPPLYQEIEAQAEPKKAKRNRKKVAVTT